jgi:hypothetical protein
MSVLQKLTEGIVNRSLQKDGDALLEKWNRTGLLEGLDSDRNKNSMACLLENQAKELLREASAMSQGDVEGFAAVAFPIVRRVFGGLVANDLVSVQPMSLPSGLIFFLDFQHTDSRLHETAATSVYGGGVVGKGIATGVTSTTGTGFYDLTSGYASPTGSLSLTIAGGGSGDADPADMSDNEINDGATVTNHAFAQATGVALSALTDGQKKSLRYDPDVLGDSDTTKEVTSCIIRLSTANMALLNKHNLTSAVLKTTATGTTDAVNGLGSTSPIRRLTHLGYTDANGAIVADSKDQHITMYFLSAAGSLAFSGNIWLHFARADAFTAGGADGSVVGTNGWGLEGRTDTPTSGLTSTGLNADIPEIDIKVDSIAVTAVTKKLKAKWTPELGQDLNAYHNLDAEVELTGILSEQIALEIDQEILNDLVQGATAGTRYWSRRPGQFLDPVLGTSITSATAPPDFTGTVSEWYETLVETINDVSATIHRKTLRGGANFLVCGPEVANILEFTSGFRAKVTGDDDKGEVGAVNVGSISKKWDVYVDPYFLRNVVLVGRKGNSFLESGYVYAPYVPLQVTPTIFGEEDFLPRKGVMTRYAKKMVRPDLYGLVVVENLIG